MVDKCGAIEIDTQITIVKVYENSVRMKGPTNGFSRRMWWNDEALKHSEFQTHILEEVFFSTPDTFLAPKWDTKKKRRRDDNHSEIYQNIKQATWGQGMGKAGIVLLMDFFFLKLIFVWPNPCFLSS